MTDVLTFTKELIKRKSITPHDQGCQALISQELEDAGFVLIKLDYEDTSNLLAFHGKGHPCFAFAGHTDVVPPGPLENWDTDPFSPTENNGLLYGRGAADMKAAVAAMVLSAKNFVLQHPNHTGTIALVITSDEEGPATHGTIKVIEYLKEKKLIPDYVVVGEASSNKVVGDAIKIGRRGSMSGEITVFGKQGHIAYPDKALNPIHAAFAALNQLAHHRWDNGNAHFPPSSFQFYEIKAGVGASNVIPGELKAKFNIRYAPLSDANTLQAKINKILSDASLNFDLTCQVSSQPYFSGECELALLAKKAIHKVCGLDARFNTQGGTSDGRHFAPLGSQVIELGAVNESIHQVNEHIDIDQLKRLQDIYSEVLLQVFNHSNSTTAS